MSGTGDLFDDIIPDDVMPPHVRSSETSRESAIRQKPVYGKRMKAVLAVFRSRGSQGATCEEVEIILGRAHQGTSSAIATLEKRGHVHTTSIKRRNLTGMNAFVVKYGPNPNKAGLPESPPKPRAKFRRKQNVTYWFQAPQGLDGEVTSISGHGKVTGRLALEGGLQYVISGRWVCSEDELAKVGEKPPVLGSGGQTP